MILGWPIVFYVVFLTTAQRKFPKGKIKFFEVEVDLGNRTIHPLVHNKLSVCNAAGEFVACILFHPQFERSYRLPYV